jgi:hypothetical protein
MIRTWIILFILEIPYFTWTFFYPENFFSSFFGNIIVGMILMWIAIVINKIIED